MRNKRKGILMASAILGSAAIVSTGFAAWVVTINDTETLDGNIQVDTVNDKSLFIEKYDEASWDNQVDFVANVSAQDSGHWLKGEGTTGEDLVAEFYVKVTIGKDRLSQFDDPTTGGLNAELTCAAYTAAASETYVGALPTVANGGIVITKVSETDTYNRVYKIEITFAWGDYFDGLNPTEFYNKGSYEDKRSDIHSDKESAKNASTELLKDVQNVLVKDEIFNALRNAEFSLLVSAKTNV